MLIWCPNIFLYLPLWHLISLKTHTHRNQAFAPTPDQYLQGKSFPTREYLFSGHKFGPVSIASSALPVQERGFNNRFLSSLILRIWRQGPKRQQLMSPFAVLTACLREVLHVSLIVVCANPPTVGSLTICWTVSLKLGSEDSPGTHSNKHNQVSWLVRTVTYTPDTWIWL